MLLQCGSCRCPDMSVSKSQAEYGRVSPWRRGSQTSGFRCTTWAQAPSTFAGLDLGILLGHEVRDNSVEVEPVEKSRPCQVLKS